MGWIIALVVGGVAGWLASLVMNRDASMGLLWNIVVGIIGSLIGNAVAGPLFGIRGSVQEFSLIGLLIAFAGAVVLLAIVNLVQRRRIR
ncbi:MAG: GlsB/YeaQ/YmgE family stress response membrane protein [Verrucomicrobiaceae bacterium]|nr:MAG: GlsB/YeaQ/YmgE family stress response membrane protein [Verrucomicrobiaceae bacterium]